MHQGRYPGNDWRRGVSPMRRFQDPVRHVSLDRYILKGVSPLNRPEGRASTRRGVSPLNREDGNNDFGHDSTMAKTSTLLNWSLMSQTANKVPGFIETRQPRFKPPKLNLGIKSSTNNQNMQASKKETVKVPGASTDAKRKPLPSSSEVSTSKEQTSSVKTVTPSHTKKAVDVSTMDLPEWNSDLSRSASSSSTSCSSSTSLDLNEENVMTKHTAESDQTSPAKAPKKKVRFSQVAWSSDVDERTIKTRFSKPQSECDRDGQPLLRPPPPPLVPYTRDANRRLVPPMSKLSLEDIQLINESRKRRRDMSSVHTSDVKKRKVAPPDGRNEVGYVTRPKQWWLRKRRQLSRKQDKQSSSSTSSSAVSATTSATTASPGSASSSCPTSISAAPTAFSSHRRSFKRRAPDDDCCSGDGVKRSRLN
ncbi:uncharacterized protein LOC124262097 isoform X2 [Haliotis rubra]|uniref:uncharacterized protein LOC124262097 isoform X2 n=1 Tax=Haliotis rubra TaxID=36100 RepID=UPI001EE624DD|nr:uncharacterized protein LOC124262097 isoform X2 [Haliotis rubra]